MKPEDLLEMSAAELTLMDEVKLTEHFSPMFTVTRPERVERKVTPQALPQLKVSNAENDILKGLGIDISILQKQKRRY